MQQSPWWKIASMAWTCSHRPLLKKIQTHVWSDLSLKLELFIIYYMGQKLVPSRGTYLLLILSFPGNYSIICHPLDKKYSRSFICWRFFTFNFECSITATHFTKDLNNDVSGVIQSTCIVMDFVMINQFIACNLKLDKSIDSTTWLKLFWRTRDATGLFSEICGVKEQPMHQQTSTKYMYIQLLSIFFCGLHTVSVIIGKTFLVNNIVTSYKVSRWRIFFSSSVQRTAWKSQSCMYRKQTLAIINN